MSVSSSASSSTNRPCVYGSFHAQHESLSRAGAILQQKGKKNKVGGGEIVRSCPSCVVGSNHKSDSFLHQLFPSRDPLKLPPLSFPHFPVHRDKLLGSGATTDANKTHAVLFFFFLPSPFSRAACGIFHHQPKKKVCMNRTCHNE